MTGREGCQWLVDSPILTGIEPMHPSTLNYLTSRDVAEEYDEYFGDSPLFAYDTRLLTRWFAEPGRLLDVGCGTGRHVIAFARRGHRVVGIDLSVHMLAVAAEKIAQAGVNGTIIRTDMMALPMPFAPGSFDYAACMFSTLGLVAGRANRRALLVGIAEALGPGGLLAVHAHNRWHGLTRADGVYFLAANLWETWRGRAEWGDKILWYYRGIRNMYVHVFSRGELRDLLTEAGLIVRQIVPLNRRRSGPLRLSIATGLRANGFIALAEKPA